MLRLAVVLSLGVSWSGAACVPRNAVPRITVGAAVARHVVTDVTAQRTLTRWQRSVTLSAAWPMALMKAETPPETQLLPAENNVLCAPGATPPGDVLCAWESQEVTDFMSSNWEAQP